MSRKIVYFTRIFQNHLILTQKQIIMDLQKLFEEIETMHFTLEAYDCFGKKVMFFDMEGRLVKDVLFTNVQCACRYAIALAISNDFSNHAVNNFQVVFDNTEVSNTLEISKVITAVFSIENQI